MHKARLFIILVALSLTTSTAYSGHQPSTTSPIKERIVFYVVAGNPPFIGPATPSNITKTPNDLLLYAIENASDKEAFVLETFSLAGEKGSFFTTLLVFTKDGNGFKGWNLVITGGKTEKKYVSIANGKRADMVLAEALYMVLARIDLDATEERLSPEALDQKLKPYLDYLSGLL